MDTLGKTAEVLICTRLAGMPGSAMGFVSVNVAVGYVLVSITRRWNWLSRPDRSLETVVMSAVNVADGTVVPVIVMLPVTEWVRPTAVVLCPKRTSGTR